MTDRKIKAKNGLITRCFHIYGKDGIVERQGIIRNYLGDGRYLGQDNWQVDHALRPQQTILWETQ